MTDSSAPGEDRSIALAFVNTRRRQGRAIVDEVASGEALRDFLEARSSAVLDLPVRESQLERFHSLRAAIRDLMRAAVRRSEPPAGSLLFVNRTSRGAPRVLALEWPTGGPPDRRYVSTTPNPLDRAAGEIVADAIELLTGPRSADLVECAGPGCLRFLLKDHPRRRWCSLSCGERTRASRYYRRRRAEGHTDTLTPGRA